MTEYFDYSRLQELAALVAVAILAVAILWDAVAYLCKDE